MIMRLHQPQIGLVLVQLEKNFSHNEHMRMIDTQKRASSKQEVQKKLKLQEIKNQKKRVLEQFQKRGRAVAEMMLLYLYQANEAQ